MAIELPSFGLGAMLRRNRNPLGSFDETVEAKLESTIDRLQREGKWTADVEETLSSSYSEAIRNSAVRVADNWLDENRKYLRKVRRFERRFERRIRKDYGTGLDRLQTFVAVTTQAGNTYSQSDRANRRDSYYVQSLSGLHARSCRVANEVHCLLRTGYPRAALARTRTLHELSVVATVLADHEHTHPDLAERYVLHERVLNLGDARVFQSEAAESGIQPFEQGFIDSLSAVRAELVARYGAPYKKPFGWAAEVVGNPDPKFDQLEKLADLSHMRGRYKWATREVHADSKGLRLNTVERGGQLSYLSGATNVGFADPAQIAASALNSVTVALLLRVEHPSPSDTLTCASLSELARDIGQLFATGEAGIDDREKKLQARLARKAKPTDTMRE